MNAALQARGGRNIPPTPDFLRPEAPTVSAGRVLVPLTSGPNIINEHLPPATPRRGLYRRYKLGVLFGTEGPSVLNYGPKSVDIGITLQQSEGSTELVPAGTTVDPFGTSTPGLPESETANLAPFQPIYSDDAINVNVETAGVVEADQVFAAVIWEDCKDDASEVIDRLRLTPALQTLLEVPEGRTSFPGVVYTDGSGFEFMNHDSIDHGAEFQLQRVDGSFLTLAFSDPGNLDISAGEAVQGGGVEALAIALSVGLQPGEKLLVRLTEATTDGDVYLQGIFQLQQQGPTQVGGGGAF